MFNGYSFFDCSSSTDLISPTRNIKEAIMDLDKCKKYIYRSTSKGTWIDVTFVEKRKDGPTVFKDRIGNEIHVWDLSNLKEIK
jgi:hypothetical protein